MPFEIGNVYKKKEAFGLDIGAHAVKVCQLKKSGKLTKLVGYGKADLPSDIIVEGIISDPEEVAKALKTLMTKTPWGRITAEKVVVSLPESKLFTRVLELPHMDKKEMDEAINWETEQYIPVPIADLYVDYEIIKTLEKEHAGKKETVNEIILVAAPKSIVDSYMQVFKILDLEPGSIEMSLMSMTRSLVTPKVSGAVMIINFGADATDVGVVFNQVLRLTGSSATGSDHMTEAISKGLKISEKEADEIKKKFGISEWGLKKNVLDALGPALETILSEINKITRYYAERVPEAKNNKIHQILLTGGGSNMPGLKEYIAEKTKLPVDIGNPWANITIYPLKPVPKNEVPMYSTVIGLALRGVVENG